MKQGMFWAETAFIGAGGIAVLAAEAEEAGSKDGQPVYDGKTTEEWKPVTWSKAGRP